MVPRSSAVWLIVVSLAVLSYKTDAAISAWTNPAIASGSLVNGGGSAAATPTIAEDLSPGSTMVTISATGDGTVTYAIASQPTNGKLTLAPDTGLLTLAAGQAFDFETEPTYVLVIHATDDNDGDIGTATVTLSITNVDEAPTFASTEYTKTIADGAGAGTSLITVTATDQDAGSHVTYSIISGNTNSDFTVSNNGLISVNTGKTLNATATPTYTLKLQASDSTNQASTIINVSVGSDTSRATNSDGNNQDANNNNGDGNKNGTNNNDSNGKRNGASNLSVAVGAFVLEILITAATVLISLY